MNCIVKGKIRVAATTCFTGYTIGSTFLYPRLEGKLCILFFPLYKKGGESPVS